MTMNHAPPMNDPVRIDTTPRAIKPNEMTRPEFEAQTVLLAAAEARLVVRAEDVPGRRGVGVPYGCPGTVRRLQRGLCSTHIG